MKYTPNPQIIVRTIRGQRILVPIMNDMNALDSLYTLNETASFIWENASNGRSDTEISQKMVEFYEIESKIAENDVKTVLSELVHLGALLENQENAFSNE